MCYLLKIKLDLKRKLSYYRYKHSLRVAKVAKKLAGLYGVSKRDAYLAGLLHDIAKEFSVKEDEKWISKYNLNRELLENSKRKICHAEIGGIVARELYGVNDEIVEAIRYHTIGNVNMSLLAKIVFVADKIEDGKSYFGIEEEKKLAYKDINLALIKCIENNRSELFKEGKSLNVETCKLLKYLYSKSD